MEVLQMRCADLERHEISYQELMNMVSRVPYVAKGSRFYNNVALQWRSYRCGALTPRDSQYRTKNW